MKKIALLLIAFLMIGASSLQAQKQVGYTIKSKISITGTDDPNILASIPDVSYSYMFGNYTKSVMEGQGYNIISINNGDAKLVDVVFDITGMGKYIIESNEDEINEAQKTIKTEYTYTGEKRTIAGYDCEKVLVKQTNLETDEEKEIILYVSKDLNSNAAVNFGSYSGLVGFPLYVEVKMDVQGTEVTEITEAIEVTADKKIKLVDFMLPSDGKKLTKEEFAKLFGGGDDEDDE